MGYQNNKFPAPQSSRLIEFDETKTNQKKSIPNERYFHLSSLAAIRDNL